MAVVETIDPTDINLALGQAFGPAMAWQMDSIEWESRLDEAAYAVAAILNRPYYEADLPHDERAAAERRYREQPYAIDED
jgi:hypothetical protein